MSKKCRVGRSGLIFFLLSTKPEIVVPGSGIGFRYLVFENSGKMTNYAVFSTFFGLNVAKKLAVE